MLPPSSRPSRRERPFIAAAAVFSLYAVLQAPASAVTPEPVAKCEAFADAAAADLTARIVAALQSRHPDHVTRLFAVDAAVKGFASPVARTDYAGIRDYFLYFLQYEPTLTFEARKIETGCNFAVDSGTYVWTLKPRDATAAVQYAIPARYRMTIERVGASWQISELIEEPKNADTAQTAALFSLPVPQSSRAAGIAQTAPAVAGFLKRSDDGAVSAPNAAAISRAPRAVKSAPTPSDEPVAETDPTPRSHWFEIGR